MRRRAIGAEVVSGGVEFRVWAPAHQRASVVIDDTEHQLEPEGNGYFRGTVASASAGTRYRYRIDGDGDSLPDPASRFQPEGPHGPSQVVDPRSYRWRETAWRGIGRKGIVVYELHVGTFTQEGTFRAAIDHLASLASIGINVIEVMPVAEFPGTFGWGYDGVDLYAPSHLYGTPDDLRRFVEEAHSHGIAVILDVVYNHFGPDGCYLRRFTPDYFTDRYENEWGDAVNFDGPGSAGVREFFVENAAYWIDEFHLDGLRFDATQSICDRGEHHILQKIVEAAHTAAGDRSIFLVAENEPEDRKLLTEYGLDALWNDDWHHSARVALTGRREAYYTDYTGRAHELVSMARLGFLYQGQRYRWQRAPRGTPTRGIAADRFVCYLQNHDQIANSVYGHRLHQIASPACFRAMTALLLLQPQTPMLFQGQEFASSAPMLYFADHEPELAANVADGRREFLAQFPPLKSEAVQKVLAPPHERATFERCKLDHDERESHADVVRLHRDLIALRRQPPFVDQRNDWLEGAAITDDCLALRWYAGGDADRILFVNLGATIELDTVNEPILAPAEGATRWTLVWSSESVDYGGAGTAEPEVGGRWTIPAHCAVVLSPDDESSYRRGKAYDRSAPAKREVG